MNRKRIVILAVVIACLATMSAGTAAYFTVRERAYNVITMGNLKMALHDETADGEPFPTGGEINVMPDTKEDKVVYIGNVGQADFYTRIRLDNTVTAEDGSALPFEHIEFNFDRTNWIEQDGYYYYHRALCTGEETEPLFTELRFLPTMTNEYKNCTIDVKVNAQAVQSRNNAEDPLTAVGWVDGKANDGDPGETNPDDTNPDDTNPDDNGNQG